MRIRQRPRCEPRFISSSEVEDRRGRSRRQRTSRPWRIPDRSGRIRRSPVLLACLPVVAATHALAGLKTPSAPSRHEGEHRTDKRSEVIEVTVVVYADFTDPYSYLASRRVDALRAAGRDIDWRAVESQRQVPVTGTRNEARLADLARQRQHVATLLADREELPGPRLGFLANTEAAVSAYAEAYGAGVADDVRRLLFALYWEHGVDIGNPNALRTPLAAPIMRGNSPSDPLRRFGYAVSGTRGPITTSAWRRIRAWRDEWETLGARELPVVADSTGPALSGTAALSHLAEQMKQANTQLNTVLTKPPSQPGHTVRAPIGWASQTGGTWNQAGWAAAQA
jgi:hypothetical protein